MFTSDKHEHLRVSEQHILHCNQVCLRVSNQDCVYGEFIYKQVYNWKAAELFWAFGCNEGKNKRIRKHQSFKEYWNEGKSIK